MSIENVGSAVAAQQQVMLQGAIGIKVIRLSLDAELAQAQALIQMMNQSAGIGTTVNTQAQ